MIQDNATHNKGDFLSLVLVDDRLENEQMNCANKYITRQEAPATQITIMNIKSIMKSSSSPSKSIPNLPTLPIFSLDS